MEISLPLNPPSIRAFSHALQGAQARPEARVVDVRGTVAAFLRLVPLVHPALGDEVVDRLRAGEDIVALTADDPPAELRRRLGVRYLSALLYDPDLDRDTRTLTEHVLDPLDAGAFDTAQIKAMTRVTGRLRELKGPARERHELAFSAIKILVDAWRHESPALRSFGDASFEITLRLATVAVTHDTLVLVGEPGTGKSHAARVVHELGPRRSGPFVTLRCDSLAVDSRAAARLPRLYAGEEGTLVLDGLEAVSERQAALVLHLLDVRPEGWGVVFTPSDEETEEASSVSLTLDARVAAAAAVHLPRLAERDGEDARAMWAAMVQGRCSALQQRGVTVDIGRVLELVAEDPTFGREEWPEARAEFPASAWRLRAIAEGYAWRCVPPKSRLFFLPVAEWEEETDAILLRNPVMEAAREIASLVIAGAEEEGELQELVDILKLEAMDWAAMREGSVEAAKTHLKLASAGTIYKLRHRLRREGADE